MFALKERNKEMKKNLNYLENSANVRCRESNNFVARYHYFYYYIQCMFTIYGDKQLAPNSWESIALVICSNSQLIGVDKGKVTMSK